MSVKIVNLSHEYMPGSALTTKALNNINLTINKGEFIGIIGRTGSGKSTLIQHLNGLLKPTSGNIFVNDIDINLDKKNLRLTRQKVGLVFQYPEHQLFDVTVFDDVAFGPKNMGFSKDEVKELVENALKTVGIKEKHYNKSPLDLSGGQKRRVAIAGVLAMNPEILILDEPTAGLDPKGRDDILYEIAKMREALGITIILVSHSMEEVARFVDRIIVMYKGEVALDNTPEKVFMKSEYLESIGLAAPQVSYLVNELNKKGFDIPNNLYTIEQVHESLAKILIPDGKVR